MIGSIDLVLATLERALATSVLPATSGADAKQEAALGALFARWLRDVVDHAGDAERASQRDVREALARVVALGSERRLGASSAIAIETARALLDFAPATVIAEIRDELRRTKNALARALRAAREDDDADLATALREILMHLSALEIERELAFARATGMDPDAATVTPLAELARRR